jgi:TonB family protein
MSFATLETGRPAPDGLQAGSGKDSETPIILYSERARYSEEARMNKIEGTVVLSVVFNVSGRISDVRTIAGLPYVLTENAIEAAKRLRFQPAARNGTPVSARGLLTFSFTLY